MSKAWLCHLDGVSHSFKYYSGTFSLIRACIPRIGQGNIGLRSNVSSQSSAVQGWRDFQENGSVSHHEVTHYCSELADETGQSLVKLYDPIILLAGLVRWPRYVVASHLVSSKRGKESKQERLIDASHMRPTTTTPNPKALYP